MNLKKLIGNFNESLLEEFTTFELLNNRHELFTEKQNEKLDVVMEIASAYISNQDDVRRIYSADDVYAYVLPKLLKQDIRREHFFLLSLDAKNNVRDLSLLFSGGVDNTGISLAIVLKKAILKGARRTILVHNHPSGDPTPSPEDIEITKDIRNIFEVAGIELSDHIIIGGAVTFKSLKEDGYI